MYAQSVSALINQTFCDISREKYIAGFSDEYEGLPRPWAGYPSLSRCKPGKDTVLNYWNAISRPSQHFKPSEQDVQARDDLLDRLHDILCERFGSGFDVEYVGIGRYAADIKQAPMEVAIVVCIGPLVPFYC